MDIAIYLREGLFFREKNPVATAADGLAELEIRRVVPGETPGHAKQGNSNRN
jgi:hypothetical protein